MRFGPLLLLALALVLFFVFDLDRFLSFETLRAHRFRLIGLVEAYGGLAVAAYILIYTVAVALSVPGATVLTITGGFLFGVWLSTCYTVIGASAGAVLIFLAARTALGDSMKNRAGGVIDSMLGGFRENAFNYLLVLRLVPLFPFFAVNLAAALAGLRLKTYITATAIGIVPGTFVYAQVGAGLGSVFDSGENFSAAGILTPQVVVALVGLAVLALLPVVYKRVKARRRSS